jgi:hypothetical protein
MGRASGDGRAHRVANEIAGVMVLEELRILGEHRALLRLLDVALDPHQPFFARLVEEVEHHLERVEVEALGELRSPENPVNPLAIFFKTCIGLAASMVPIAAPPMITNSEGCMSTRTIGPFSIMKPARTAPKTMTIPMIEIMSFVPLSIACPGLIDPVLKY